MSNKRNKKNKFRKEVHYITSTFDANTALIKLRKFAEAVRCQYSEEDLIRTVLTKETAVDEFAYATPCLCRVRYDVELVNKSYSFCRHYVAYGINEYDIDAYLDYLIQLDIQAFDEAATGHYDLDYEVEDIRPCIIKE